MPGLSWLINLVLLCGLFLSVRSGVLFLLPLFLTFLSSVTMPSKVLKAREELEMRQPLTLP